MKPSSCKKFLDCFPSKVSQWSVLNILVKVDQKECYSLNVILKTIVVIQQHFLRIPKK